MRKLLSAVLWVVISGCSDTDVYNAYVSQPDSSTVLPLDGGSHGPDSGPTWADATLLEGDSAVAELDASLADASADAGLDAQLEADAAQSDSAAVDPGAFVAVWACTYTQTTNTAGETLSPPRIGNVSVSITQVSTNLFTVQDALGLSGNITGSLDGALLVAQNDKSAYRLKVDGSTLTGSWTNLMFPKMLMSLLCTQ